MLARMLTVAILILVAASAAWGAWWWPRSPWLAVLGAAGILGSFAVLLALQFLLLAWTSRGDSAVRPKGSQLVRAWWHEMVTAALVFFWWQPFRWRAEPDVLAANGSRGIVFIHGFVCNRGLWTPWLRRLRREGTPFVAVNLEPVYGSIDDYVDAIDGAVARVAAASGRAPMLVCHSMGGLAARLWLCKPGADARVSHIVTIGTPHHGTWLGKFAHSLNGRQMRLNSRWLQELERQEPAERYSRFTCWYSSCDNIVFPVSTATLPGATNLLLSGPAHVELAFAPEVMAHTLAQLRSG